MRLYADSSKCAGAFPLLPATGIVHVAPCVADMLELVEIIFAELIERHADTPHGNSQKIIYPYGFVFFFFFAPSDSSVDSDAIA